MVNGSKEEPVLGSYPYLGLISHPSTEGSMKTKEPGQFKKSCNSPVPSESEGLSLYQGYSVRISHIICSISISSSHLIGITTVLITCTICLLHLHTPAIPANSYSQLNLYCFTYVLSCILYIATDLSINPDIFCPPLSPVTRPDSLTI